ncbi:MAG: DUF4270 family protein [Bacteroidota bacterium]
MLLVFSLSNCKKPEDIGLNTLPADDLLYTEFTDTVTILSTTIREDSLRADELSRVVFGSVRDNVTGLTTSEYYGQVLLSSTPNLIADSVNHTWAADSLVLSLAYIGAYGDTAFQPHIHVYQLTEDMHVDSQYYSNKSFLTDPTELELTGSPYDIAPNTYLHLNNDNDSTPRLRIKLNNTLRDAIFDKNGETEFASNDNWKAYFKGLHIKVDPVQGNGGALMYFNPTSASTRLTLYYHEDTIAKSYSFTLSSGARLHHTEHDYTGTTVETQLNSPTQEYDDNYMQPMAGLKTKISFPYLKHFNDSGSILINKAELVITEHSDTATNRPAPSSILFLSKNATGTYEFPIDYFERSYGGTLSSATRTYTFGITRTIQRILDGTITDYGYTLNILGSMIAGNTATIGSGKAGGAQQMKLRLYYTKLQ